MAFSWTDFEEIALALVEAHPEVEPLDVNFPQLRQMVRDLAGFTPEKGQKANEQILEAIQVAWQEEKDELDDEGPVAVDDEEENDEELDYEPNNPYR